MAVGLAIHLLAATVWIGGLFFIVLILRPSARPLEAPVQLPLWTRTLARFLAWGWIGSIVLLASGFAMAFAGFGGLARAPVHVRAMMAIGIVAGAAYAYLTLGPWRRFRRAAALSDWAAAEKSLGPVFLLSGVTLALAIAAAVAGASGRYAG